MLRTDLDSAVNFMKAKDKTILELTEKLQALEVSTNKQLESYSHNQATLEGKLA